MSNAVGIDFGTCFCRVAAITGGQVELLEKMPSRVACKGDRFVAGDAALKYNPSYLSNSVSDVARFEVPMATNLLVSRHDLSRMMLRHLKYVAEKHWEGANDVMIVVPYSFDFKRRRIIAEVASSAGLNVKRLVNEPVAAAVAYKHLHHAEKEMTLFLVMGGSSFDIAAIAIDKGVNVKAVAGDLSMGGKDFTSVLMKYCLSNIKAEVDVAATRKLWHLCERAKKQLSSHLHVTIKSKSFLPAVDVNIDLSRELMERLASQLISKMEGALAEVKDTLMTRSSKPKKVILVGGSTNMPWISRMIEVMFGQVEISNVSSGYIAIGMAVMAAYSTEVVDILPCRILFKAAPNFIETDIPRHTVLPACVELEVQLFRKQQNILFAAYEYQGYDPLVSISVTHYSNDWSQIRLVSTSLYIDNELKMSIGKIRPKKCTYQNRVQMPSYPPNAKTIISLLDV